ncbi:MAG: hypothetical protein FJ271_23440 [Planctomycetes bacterium]|nr:hypothetical protein [Planctomycetota bacterium]
MDFTVENICGFLIRSRLVSPEDVRSAHMRWLGEAKEPGNVGHFARWLVANKYVTEYQASLIVKGHADAEHFFLNQYQILDRLGRGRMAGVYKAVHHLGQVVAIKVLPPSKAKKPVLLGRFQREARMATRLKHPNVVRAFQLGEANELHYLVMEFLEGETLEDVLQRRRRLPPGEAVRVIYQALLGLQHIHEQGMVHRDLKPSNVMLVSPAGKSDPDSTQKALVKILDIGLGREVFEEGTQENAELTGEGILLGTPDYLAPEQARDARSIDIRADIYSLGCVLYHCLTGQPPFPDTNLLSQMVRHATETPRPLREFNPAIPEGLQQIINWMVAKKPEERYPTPERAAQALQVFLVAESEPARPAEEPQMRKYLTWLETSADSRAEELAPIAAAAPAIPVTLATPAAAPAPAATAAPAPTMPRKPSADPAKTARAASVRKEKRAALARSIPTAQPAPTGRPVSPASSPAAPLAEEQFDVELVSVDGLAQHTGWRAWLPRNSREWTLVGVGAGSVAIAWFIGLILAMILGD